MVSESVFQDCQKTEILITGLLIWYIERIYQLGKKVKWYGIKRKNQICKKSKKSSKII
ncbi:hypothetical protein ANACAC_02918 [Anaerostipes caccae L1-92]|uniref:Uncharacterized protein n=1 Tax=Anaerostipes caccae (strain DSM 14662 / CCUG 47493 / JCM 13470 / NCIMB 13811 / L1-92) TaxID=411490 RepID=B0MHF6_ANACD|nr:hypothetical protein ANACAC_02918 [Anaerostipes caccae L1-92]